MLPTIAVNLAYVGVLNLAYADVLESATPINQHQFFLTSFIFFNSENPLELETKLLNSVQMLGLEHSRSSEAQLFVLKGDWQSAFELYQDTPKRNSLQQEAYAQLAWAIGENETATKLFVESGGFTPTFLGDLFFEQQELAKAAEMYQFALAASPDNLQANIQLCRLISSQDIDKAITYCQTAVKAHPEDWSAHRFLAAVLGESGDLLEAISAAETSVELYENAYSARTLGMLLAQNNELEAAEEWLLRSLTYDETAFAYLWLGYVYMQRGLTAQASESFQQALHINPNYQQAQTALDALNP